MVHPAHLLDRDALYGAARAHIDYLRDLGIFDLYRREGSPEGVIDAVKAGLPPISASRTAESETPALKLPLLAASHATDQLFRMEEESAIAPRKPATPPIAFTPGPLISPDARGQVLEALRLEIGDCTRCPLGFAGRHKVVFGDGDPNARLLFVGEGPGADEDMQGVPFVGRAGQLLNNMIAAMGLKREQVYIANIVKCRPPKNRVPEPVEATTCSQFLYRQIDIIRPQVIVALGSTAATYLLGSKSPLSALRGRTHSVPVHPEVRLIVTYHPAYLLRDPTQKKAAWIDLQMAMAELKAAG